MTGNSTVRALLLTALLMTAVQTSAATAQSCRPPPDAVRDLDIPRYYSDAAGTKVDPALKAVNEAAVAPLVAFLREVVRHADAAQSSAKAEKREASARCALSWLENWARAGAWLGKRITQQGEYQRKWDLGGAALAYIKVKAFASPGQRRVVEPWLLRVAGEARGFFDNPERKRNNHWFWLGLALGGVAIATGDESMWGLARGIAQDAARDILADGALPMELERGERALHYHAFAAMPLIVLAELAALRGEDFYASGDGALHRLAGLTLKGFADPQIFERLSGTRQVLVASSPGAGWLPLYAQRFPDRVKDAGVSMRMGDRRLGGDVSLLLKPVRDLAR
jgi:poly(beta-D-mannuronate) lyase